jgi:hypothetical protein
MTSKRKHEVIEISSEQSDDDTKHIDKYSKTDELEEDLAQHVQDELDEFLFLANAINLSISI